MGILIKQSWSSGFTRPVDEELIIKIADGDMEAFRDLYDAAAGSVYGFVLSILKNKYDADDVLQDTFLKIYSNASEYEPKGKPLAWILTIAKNSAYSKLRDTGKTESLEEQNTEPIDFSSMENAEQRLLVETLFKYLTDEEKQILLLHSVSGMKYREIASFMDIPLNTVLSKYHRAVKKLKEKITEE
ncbi:MAG: RNA polymerase sigma factor [Ruminococcaceae bacterium]|nr:RNA polymerase sigma factor [Oscillospiraceae bacterium]